MTSYHPSVTCDETEHDEPVDCSDILSSMPTSRTLQGFGNIRYDDVQVSLPYKISSGKLPPLFRFPPLEKDKIALEVSKNPLRADQPSLLRTANHRCTALVGIKGARSTTTWYRIWEEMVAIEGMCIKNGKDGKAAGLGKLFSHLPLPAPDSSAASISGVAEGPAG